MKKQVFADFFGVTLILGITVILIGLGSLLAIFHVVHSLELLGIFAVGFILIVGAAPRRHTSGLHNGFAHGAARSASSNEATLAAQGATTSHPAHNKEFPD